MKKALSVLIAFLICLSCGVTAFASTASDPSAADVGKEVAVTISEKTLGLTQADKEAYSTYGQDLVTKLSNYPVEDYDAVIEAFCKSNTNPVFDKVLNEIRVNKSNENIIRLKLSPALYEAYEEVYTIGNDKTLTITPTYIVVSDLKTTDLGSELVGHARGTNSKWGICSETYYGLLGNKLFSLAVECTFYYNGQKAWYKSGFDYYYTKGFLSIWQVSNWKGWKESSGTSYKAYCAGNFHFGLEYEGNGLVIQDFYCKNTLTCSKNGTISKYATHS